LVLIYVAVNDIEQQYNAVLTPLLPVFSGAPCVNVNECRITLGTSH